VFTAHAWQQQASAVKKRGVFWLASYPKSGNTWLRAALTSLRNGGAEVDINALGGESDTISSSRGHFDRTVDADSSDLTAEECLRARPYVFRQLSMQQTDVAFWKAHEACITVGEGIPLFPPEASIGAVYLVRDPRDVAISLAHHLECAIDDAILMMSDPAAKFGASTRRLSAQLAQPLMSWSLHVRSWLARSEMAAEAPVSVIRYEDMQADLVAVLALVADHVGWSVDETSLQAAAAATRFERLQRQEQSKGFRERARPTTAFFREGRVSAWRERLSAAQVAAIERDHGEVMALLGYEKLS
jgi:aryl sulfotransferase